MGLRLSWRKGTGWCKKLSHFEAKTVKFSKLFGAPDAGKMFLHRTVEICGRSVGLRLASL